MHKLLLKKGIPSLLITKLKNLYHIEDLLVRNYQRRVLYVYLPMIDVYTQKIFKSTFNERFFITHLIELQKSNASPQIFQKMFELAQKNIDKIVQLESISSLLSNAYMIKYKNKQVIKNIANRGFQILDYIREHHKNKVYSYHSSRILIAIHNLIGLTAFPNSIYSSMNLDKCKPLFITYIIEIFWRQNLEDQYPIVKQLIDVLLKQQTLIPFTDVHHMLVSTKKIKNPQYTLLVKRLQKKMRNNLQKLQNQQKQQKQQQTTNVDQNQITEYPEQLVEEMTKDFLNDLRMKYI